VKKQFFHFPKSAEQRKRWIEVLNTSGILPQDYKMYSFVKTTFQKIILQVLKKLDFVDVACRSHQLFVPNSQCHKITVSPDKSKNDNGNYRTSWIPDPEVVPERAHSSKFAGQMLQLFQRT
jgi:hypothetical protein